MYENEFYRVSTRPFERSVGLIQKLIEENRSQLTRAISQINEAQKSVHKELDQ